MDPLLSPHPSSALASATSAAASASAASGSQSAAAASASNAAASAAAAQVAKITWRGNWSSATAYVTTDAVHYLGRAYVCTLANSNQTPPFPPATSTFWGLLAEKGVDGTGAGDMLKAENLLGLTNYPSARTNLGATTVGGALFTTASAAAARTTLGFTAIGDGLATAASAAAARSTIGAAAAVDLPVGVVFPFVGTVAPSNFLLCAGQAISRTTYAALFTAVGTTFGLGDGSTTFNLPDLRGRAIAGKDDMGGTAAGRITSAGSGIVGTTLGAVGGDEEHVLTVAQMPAHHHREARTTDAGSQVSHGLASGQKILQADWGIDTFDTGGGGAHNNTQPTLILNYIIKVLP